MWTDDDLVFDEDQYEYEDLSRGHIETSSQEDPTGFDLDAKSGLYLPAGILLRRYPFGFRSNG